MIPTASEMSTEPERAGDGPADPLRRVVHFALAIYLLPVVAIVCAIGGVAIAFDRASGLVSRRATGGRRGAKPWHFAPDRSGEAGWRMATSQDGRRTRVGR